MGLPGRPVVTVRECLAWAARRLRECGVPGAAADAAVLLATVLGTDRAGVYARYGEALAPDRLELFREMVERRGRREPLAYITGEREFMSLAFRVDPRVFVPRPETEVLVEEALERLRRRTPGGELRVAEVGTGSGAVAVALAYHLPGCRVVATDASPGALEVARENAARHGVGDRITFVAGAGVAPLAPWAPYAAVLCNPPYVAEGEAVDPEVLYEPREAWYAGPDPLAPCRELLGAADLLEPGGFLAVEVGRGRAAAVAALFDRRLTGVTVRPDLAGIPRVVVGCAPGGGAGRRCAGGEGGP